MNIELSNLKLIKKGRLITIVIMLLLFGVHFSSALSVFAQSSNKISAGSSEFNFAAAGDWGCKEMSQRTVNNIRTKDPELVLALGDFSYQKDTGCWFRILSPILNKTRIVIGEHDYDTNNSTRLYDYVKKFNLSDPYYSFNYRDVHFLAMSSVNPFNNQSLQYKLLRDDSMQKQFVSDDLYAASQNKSIDWIVVFLYKPIYSSPTYHESEEFLRDSYHPLFDLYGVDLVLQAHNHNYQRSFPIRYNATNSSIPLIVDHNPNTYINPNGTIFMTVGTAGAEQYNFTSQAPFIAKQFERFGFLDVKIADNGTKMIGTFYDNRDGSEKDSFTIILNKLARKV
jgi:Calcineurin-like phosphoesterase